MWVPRTIESTLWSLARKHPVVVVAGPRQSGKTSLLRRVFPSLPYWPLDDPGIQAAFLEDPRGMLDAEPSMILDEVQATPEIFPHIKAAVDRNRRPGRFLLTGSQDLLVSSQISESLAGRAVYITLLAFDPAEWSAAGSRRSRRWLDACAFPEPFLHADRRDTWLRGYVQTYLQRDVRSVAEVGNLRDFARFLRILALRNGAMLNLSDVARDVSVAPNTIKRWLSILEAGYQIFLLEPHLSNLTLRMIKRPKLYFVEPWIAWHLAGGPPRNPGMQLECSLIAAVHRWAAHTERYRLSYFRTKEGAEVDLVLEPRARTGQATLAIEIKNTRTFSPALLRGLRTFARTRDDKARLILVSQIRDHPRAAEVEILTPSGFLDVLK